MKRILFLIAASHVLMSTMMLAQGGSTGLAFLKIGVGGRALGMGEAYSALAADPTAGYYNPAALSLANRSQVLLMHREWIQGVKTEFLGGMTSAGNLAFAVSLNSTNISDLELRENPGPAIGTFGSHDGSVGLSAAYAFGPDFSIGFTGKYLFEKIYTDETTGFGIDAGLSYLTPWNIRLAAAVSNLGSMNVLRTEAPTLPRMIRTGAAYRTTLDQLDGVVTLAADLVSVTDEHLTHVHTGAEFDYHNTLALRAGYQSGYDARNISAGLGLRYGFFRIDYAFVPFQYDLGATHTISLTAEFD